MNNRFVSKRQGEIVYYKAKNDFRKCVFSFEAYNYILFPRLKNEAKETDNLTDRQTNNIETKENKLENGFVA
jgi:hypothetical protein